MSLVTCLECNKEISDKADNCIHCGCPCKKEPQNLPRNSEKSKYRNSEKQINKAVDIFFSLIYIYLFYQLFFTDTFPKSDSGAYMFGLFMGFVFLYFIQKMTKAILGTVARSFDAAFNKEKQD